MEDNVTNPTPVAPPTPSPATPNVRKEMVPGAVGAMIMGIISIVLFWFFYIPVLGLLFAIAQLILGLMAMKKGKAKLELFNQNPDAYSRGSIGILKTARITGMVGFFLSFLAIILGLLFTIMVFSGNFDRMF